MALAPLHVVVMNDADGSERYEVNVGAFGRVYDLGFDDLLNLICNRQGFVRPLLPAPGTIAIDLRGPK
ncbi:MAG TPA: hypothetical protein VIY48_08640 [Candidatus Paceibacterota bacterium]